MSFNQPLEVAIASVMMFFSPPSGKNETFIVIACLLDIKCIILNVIRDYALVSHTQKVFLTDIVQEIIVVIYL